MKLKLLKVGAKWCPPCQALDKRGTLEKFEAKHPDVKVEIHDDPRADPEVGSASRWEAFVDKWNVRAFPTLIWVAGDTELLRTTDVSAAGIEAQYEKALKKMERL